MEGFKPNFENTETTQVLEDIEALESQDFYERLGVAQDATQDEIKGAFRRLSAKFHPDKTHSDEALRENYSEVQKRLGEAYNMLRDESQKRRYDSKLRTTGPKAYSQPNERSNSYQSPEAQTWKKEAPLKSENLRKLQAFDNALRDLLTDGINIKEVKIEEVERFVSENMRALKDEGMLEKDILYKIRFPLLDYYSQFRKKDQSPIKLNSSRIKYALARMGITPEQLDNVEKYPSNPTKWF